MIIVGFFLTDRSSEEEGSFVLLICQKLSVGKCWKEDDGNGSFYIGDLRFLRPCRKFPRSTEGCSYVQ